MTGTMRFVDTSLPVPAPDIIRVPGYAKPSWGYVDLNNKAAKLTNRHPNPLIDPVLCDSWQKDIARKMGVDFTFGGYLEDRRVLWRDHYHDRNHMLHLGVDYNVPAGTEIAAPAACEVIYTVCDPDQGGGWGGAVYCKLESPYKEAGYVVFGHLAHASLPKVGHFFGRGELLAVVGGIHENGGWFPHLHVQCFNEENRRRYAPRLEKMDGYGNNQDFERHDMPDPTELMAGWH